MLWVKRWKEGYNLKMGGQGRVYWKGVIWAKIRKCKGESFAEMWRNSSSGRTAAIEQVLRLECAWNVWGTTRRPMWPSRVIGEWEARARKGKVVWGPQKLAWTWAFSLVREDPLRFSAVERYILTDLLIGSLGCSVKKSWFGNKKTIRDAS